MAQLTIADQLRIDQIITRIKSVTGKRYPQDSLIDIITSYANTKNEDIEIKEFDFGDDSNLIKGAIKYPDGTKPAILINNRTTSDKGKNFTLAHEFGHYVLHENETKFRLDLFDYTSDTLKSKQESEANYFAACLLMPENEFIEMRTLTNDSEKIAAYFGVSVPAVEVRKKWLETNKKT